MAQSYDKILAILSNFKKSEIDVAIPEILRKLQQLATDAKR